MKLVAVRVVVPCDDAVTTDDVKGAVTKQLQPLPVTLLGANGEEQKRIHWSAVEVVRVVERPPTQPRRRAKAPIEQGTLT